MNESKWLTYPEKDGYYWLCEDNQPGNLQAMEIVHVWPYGKAFGDGRFVEYVGTGADVRVRDVKGQWQEISVPDAPGQVDA